MWKLQKYITFLYASYLSSYKLMVGKVFTQSAPTAGATFTLDLRLRRLAWLAKILRRWLAKQLTTCEQVIKRHLRPANMCDYSSSWLPENPWLKEQLTHLQTCDYRSSWLPACKHVIRKTADKPAIMWLAKQLTTCKHVIRKTADYPILYSWLPSNIIYKDAIISFEI